MSEEMSLFNHKVLTGVIQKLPLEETFLLPKLFPEQPVDGLTTEWDVMSGSRKIEEGYKPVDGASKPASLLGGSTTTAKLGSIGLFKPMPTSFLLPSRRPGTLEKESIKAKIFREQTDLKSKILRIEEYARALAITTGKITISQADVKFDVDFGVSASNKISAAAAWGGDDADPLADIRTVKARLNTVTEYTPTYMYLNSDTFELALKSPIVLEYLRTQFGRERVAGEIPSKFQALIPVIYDKGYINGSNVFVKYIADGKVIIITDAPDFGTTHVGPGLIPQPNALPIEVSGFYSYPVIIEDPVSLKIVSGRNSLPIILRPDDIVILTVS